MPVKVKRIEPIIHNENRYEARGAGTPPNPKCYCVERQPAVIYETKVEFEVAPGESTKEPYPGTDVKLPKPGICLYQTLVHWWKFFDPGGDECGRFVNEIDEVFPLTHYTTDSTSKFVVEDVHRFGFDRVVGCDVGKTPDTTQVCHFQTWVEGRVAVVQASINGKPIDSNDLRNSDGTSVILDVTERAMKSNGKTQYKARNPNTPRKWRVDFLEDEPVTVYDYYAEIDHCSNASAPTQMPMGSGRPAGFVLNREYEGWNWEVDAFRDPGFVRSFGAGRGSSDGVTLGSRALPLPLVTTAKSMRRHYKFSPMSEPALTPVEYQRLFDSPRRNGADA